MWAFEDSVRDPVLLARITECKFHQLNVILNFNCLYDPSIVDLDLTEGAPTHLIRAPTAHLDVTTR